MALSKFAFGAYRGDYRRCGGACGYADFAAGVSGDLSCLLTSSQVGAAALTLGAVSNPRLHIDVAGLQEKLSSAPAEF